jgi:hypothetical protein
VQPRTFQFHIAINGVEFHRVAALDAAPCAASIAMTVLLQPARLVPQQLTASVRLVAELIDRHPVGTGATFIAPHLPQCLLQVWSLTYLLHEARTSIGREPARLTYREGQNGRAPQPGRLQEDVESLSHCERQRHFSYLFSGRQPPKLAAARDPGAVPVVTAKPARKPYRADQ